MNVVVVIEGREAIPVRAIPLLTDWSVMWPDVVAKALAWDEFYFNFEGLCAYRIEEGEVKPIKATWWRGFAVRDLKALSDRIKAGQVTHDAGHQKWRKESLAELPAGVFVWKDEYVPMYQWQYGPDALARSLGRELTQSERQERELNFDPFMRPELYSLVMDGFECSAIKAKELTTTPSPAPLVPTWDELHALRGVDARKEFEAWSKERASKSSEMDKAFIDEIAIGDEIAELQSKIEKWESLDCTQPSEMVIKQSNLEPLHARMKKLDAVQKYLRGDYGPKVITPSPAPEPQAAPVVAVGASGGVETDKAGPVTVKIRKKRRGWRDVTWPYLLEVFQSGKYSTAKDFYKALERKAGADSPFELGTGLNQGSLFITEISQTLSLKTIQTYAWKELRESRQTR